MNFISKFWNTFGMTFSISKFEHGDLRPGRIWCARVALAHSHVVLIGQLARSDMAGGGVSQVSACSGSAVPGWLWRDIMTTTGFTSFGPDHHSWTGSYALQGQTAYRSAASLSGWKSKTIPVPDLYVYRLNVVVKPVVVKPVVALEKWA